MTERHLADQVHHQDIPEEILEMSEKRNQAKKEKNWAEADNLRNEIQENGYNIKDTATGTIITKK